MEELKSYTDIEQSKKLAKILTIETSDMYWDLLSKSNYTKVNDIGCCLGRTCIYAWSLAALINVLPRSIEFKDDTYYLRFMKDYIEYANDEISITGRYLHTTGNNNLVDACVDMILKLHELNLLHL